MPHVNTSPVESFYAAAGGLPFVDLDVKDQLISGLVAAKRRKLNPDAFTNIDEYMMAKNAAELYARRAADYSAIPLSTELAAEQRAALSKALKDITSARPDWSSLIGLPVDFVRLAGNGISATNVFVPQTIYLGDRAFANEIPLVESVIHEMAHVWLGLLAEISDVQVADAPANLVLPSGTGGKSVRGLLFAAHYAAAACCVFRSSGFGGSRERSRLEQLAPYLSGCLRTLDEHRVLMTPMGKLVDASLRTFAATLHPEKQHS